MGHPWKHFHIWEFEILNLLEGVCTYLYNLWNFETLKFKHLKFLKLPIWNFTFVKYEFWKLTIWEFWISDILTSWNFKNLHREIMKNPICFLQNIGYELHICQKTWNGKLVIFQFLSKGIPSTPRNSDCHPMLHAWCLMHHALGLMHAWWFMAQGSWPRKGCGAYKQPYPVHTAPSSEMVEEELHWEPRLMVVAEAYSCPVTKEDTSLRSSIRATNPEQVTIQGKWAGVHVCPCHRSMSIHRLIDKAIGKLWKTNEESFEATHIYAKQATPFGKR